MRQPRPKLESEARWWQSARVLETYLPTYCVELDCQNIDRMFKEEKLITKSKLALKYNKYKYKYNKKVIKIRQAGKAFFLQPNI